MFRYQRVCIKEKKVMKKNQNTIILKLPCVTLAILSFMSVSGISKAYAQSNKDNVDVVLDEIVVTSLKRDGLTILDVPAAISTISGSEIENSGADGLDDFLQFASGTSIDRGNGAGTTTIQIRGINSTFGSASVGFYMDNLPVSFVSLNFLPDPSPFDLKQIEILKGPQGALYGAGSSGGVVLMRTNDPVLNEFSGKVDVSVSDTDGGGENYSASAAFNFPLIPDVAAFRGVLSYQDKSGWIDDSFNPGLTDLNAEERLNGRAKLLITPNEQLSIKLLGVISRNENEFGTDAADASNEFPSSLFGPFDSSSAVDFNQYGAVISYDFSSFTLTNALSYIDYESSSNRPFIASIPTDVDLETVVNEFRLNSNKQEPFSWVAGAYYRKSTQDLFQDLDALNLPVNTDDETESEQYSIFGEGAYGFYDGDLELTIGGSYFNDDTINDTNFGPRRILNEVGTSLFSPQISIAYHPTQDSTLYARYAEGFRSATVDFGLPLEFAQLVVPSLTGQVRPEEITSYEIGAKGDFADGKIHAEAAFFYNDIMDIQQFTVVSVPGVVVPVSTVLNAGEAESIGFEWLFNYKPVDELNLRFSGSYTKAEISKDFFVPGTNAANSAPLFRDGARLNLVPELIVNASASYSWPLNTSGLEGTALVSVQYSSDRALTVLASDAILGDDVVRADARLEIGKDNWSVYLFADNIANEDGAIAPTRDAATLMNAGVPLDGVSAIRFRPRTIGIGFRANY